MIIELNGKNYTPSDSLRNVTAKKCVKLDRLLHDDSAVAKFLVTLDNGTYITDLTVTSSVGTYRARSTSDSPFDNLDDVVPKLLEQARRDKDKNLIRHDGVQYPEEDLDDNSNGETDK